MYTINSFYNVDIFKDKTLDIILDDLTKAVSRPYIISYVKDLIEKKTPFTMLMLDVDNFKQINDRYGHLMGERFYQLWVVGLLNILVILVLLEDIVETNFLLFLMANIHMMMYGLK